MQPGAQSSWDGLPRDDRRGRCGAKVAGVGAGGGVKWEGWGLVDWGKKANGVTGKGNGTAVA